MKLTSPPKASAVLYKCSGEEACESFGAEILPDSLPADRRIAEQRAVQGRLHVPAEPHYLAATLARPEGQVSVSLYVAVDRGTAFPETKDRVAVLLDVVEDKPMEAKMVTVRCSEDGQGHRGDRPGRALRAVLRYRQGGAQAGISASLAEIGKLLKAQLI